MDPNQQNQQPSQAPARGYPHPNIPITAQSFQRQQQHLLHQQAQQLDLFWSYQRQDILQTADFKTHTLPLARIKKIMKADEDVRMISAEAPVLFSKACELFILELTIRSWLHAEENKRRTLQKNDIAAAITRTEIFDFLVDIVPREEAKGDEAGALGVGAPRGLGGFGGMDPGAPGGFYYGQGPSLGTPALGFEGGPSAASSANVWWHGEQGYVDGGVEYGVPPPPPPPASG
ncbi:hypothetical protein AMTRI_Chr06g171470 [Amborella trichopoda]|uniref:Core Histone H2A/H2B/H3 domain-containing protein n=1 Tax=Amborella trichopoda TaxID=13333 RepID=W1PPV8_AMBTC|nr:nuclear transcription factor Y subunit C-2 [Amborella trichopoda]ERN09839.1 hypothetical protein AMTR_s00013p00054980 [Amborella trichopoda]|eukprot:XP_006848258.1 nuclear transcription factor Y subunit C-2 [Amborella trichopoda]